MSKKGLVGVASVATVNSPFLNVDEAADFLRISRATVYTWIHKRKRTKIPVIHLGGRVVFERERLIDWVRQHPSQEGRKG